MTPIKYLKRFYWRLSAVLAFLLLLPIDFFITKTLNRPWGKVHGKTMEAVRNAWFKY